jgi:hypothetical protein
MTPIAWHDMRVKHAWHAVPDNWESLGHPAAGTIIDLYIALKPHQESALIDALYEVSDPDHSRHVLFSTPPFTHLLTFAARSQIRRSPVKGTGRRVGPAEPRYSRAREFLV